MSMMFHSLTDLFPWALAIFTVLGLVACCAWTYKCFQKCHRECCTFRISRQTNPIVTPIRSRPDSISVYTFSHAGAPSRFSRTSGPRISFGKAPPYADFADLTPPPTYNEAMGIINTEICECVAMETEQQQEHTSSCTLPVNV
ncbi:uncharacterized protein [Amphiura filiformis]|uniref:uncharacterized protein n=1 Tax=Amphiura filiformis TaxID=82378 RepID=UPI003B227898